MIVVLVLSEDSLIVYTRLSTGRECLLDLGILYNRINQPQQFDLWIVYSQSPEHVRTMWSFIVNKIKLITVQSYDISRH